MRILKCQCGNEEMRPSSSPTHISSTLFEWKMNCENKQAIYRCICGKSVVSTNLQLIQRKRLKDVMQDISPILKAFNLRSNRKKELDKAIKINNHIDSKVRQLIFFSGI